MGQTASKARLSCRSSKSIVNTHVTSSTSSNPSTPVNDSSFDPRNLPTRPRRPKTTVAYIDGCTGSSGRYDRLFTSIRLRLRRTKADYPMSCPELPILEAVIKCVFLILVRLEYSRPGLHADEISLICCGIYAIQHSKSADGTQERSRRIHQAG